MSNPIDLSSLNLGGGLASQLRLDPKGNFSVWKNKMLAHLESVELADALDVPLAKTEAMVRRLLEGCDVLSVLEEMNGRVMDGGVGASSASAPSGDEAEAEVKPDASASSSSAMKELSKGPTKKKLPVARPARWGSTRTCTACAWVEPKTRLWSSGCSPRTAR